jgi:hypothetical protein
MGSQHRADEGGSQNTSRRSVWVYPACSFIQHLCQSEQFCVSWPLDADDVSQGCGHHATLLHAHEHTAHGTRQRRDCLCAEAR